MVTFLEATYFAGFFDGEGHVSMCPTCTNRSKYGFAVAIELGLTNNSQEILEWVQSLLGGEIKPVIRQSGDVYKRKSTYRLYWKNSEDILSVINVLKNGGLRVKAEHIDLLERFVTSRLKRVAQNTPYTHEELELVKKLCDLNRRLGKVYKYDTLLEEALKLG